MEAPFDAVKIVCPTCHAQIKADDINIDDKIAKCSSCDSIFSIHDQVSKLEISVRQPWTVLEVLPLSILPFLAILFTVAFFKKDMHYLFALIPWIGTIITGIFVSQRKRHFIYLNIDEKYLSTFWRPKKLHHDKHFPIDQVDQLYVQGVNGACSLVVILNTPEGQKHIKLIKDLTSLSKAKYLEQEIERYLNIKDRKLPEEA